MKNQNSYIPEFHPIFMTTGSGFEELIYLFLFLHAIYLATIERFIYYYSLYKLSVLILHVVGQIYLKKK